MWLSRWDSSKFPVTITNHKRSNSGNFKLQGKLWISTSTTKCPPSRRPLHSASCTGFVLLPVPQSFFFFLGGGYCTDGTKCGEWAGRYTCGFPPSLFWSSRAPGFWVNGTVGRVVDISKLRGSENPSDAHAAVKSHPTLGDAHRYLYTGVVCILPTTHSTATKRAGNCLGARPRCSLWTSNHMPRDEPQQLPPVGSKSGRTGPLWTGVGPSWWELTSSLKALTSPYKLSQPPASARGFGKLAFTLHSTHLPFPWLIHLKVFQQVLKKSKKTDSMIYKTIPHHRSQGTTKLDIHKDTAGLHRAHPRNPICYSLGPKSFIWPWVLKFFSSRAVEMA
jgi:hypothetical protein